MRHGQRGFGEDGRPERGTGARLFTDLDKLREGDLFRLNILKQTLTYEVDQIRVVLPSEFGDLAIVPGEDLCTLLTCTPYGVNSHRLLVRGHRVENGIEDLFVAAEAERIGSNIVAPLMAIPIVLGFTAWMLWSGRRERRDRQAGLPVRDRTPDILYRLPGLRDLLSGGRK